MYHNGFRHVYIVSSAIDWADQVAQDSTLRGIIASFFFPSPLPCSGWILNDRLPVEGQNVHKQTDTQTDAVERIRALCQVRLGGSVGEGGGKLFPHLPAQGSTMAQ